MALSSASAVSPTLAADNAAKANTSIAAAGNGSTGTFTDSLEAVLAPPAATKTSAANGTDTNVTPLLFGKLAKLKSKLMNSEAGMAMTPQALQQQQAILQKLDAANTGIDLPALRAAMGKGAPATDRAHIMPVLNPLTGQIIATPTDNTAQTDVPDVPAANPAVANAVDAAATAPRDTAVSQNMNTAPAKDAAPKNSDANAPQPTVTASTQAKLVANLMKAAKAPVLKSGEADGSKVPNAKIAHPAKVEKTADTETVQSMAAKIAATAAISNPDDAAQTAAKGVAVAEVSARSAATATQAQSVTKIEAAALSNATQTAVHASAPQEKVEAQALPVQFDAKPSKHDGNADTQTGTSGKDQSQPGSARTASDASQKADTPATLADTQPSTPAPSHVSAEPAGSNTAASAGAAVSAPVMPSHIATTLQVSQQPQHSTPSDEATFAALGVAIAAKSKDGEKQFDINMHPAELGRVDVRISVDADGKAQAHLSAEHPQTLQLLQNDKATLERNLRDAGLDVANNGLSFSLKGEQQSSTPTFNARSRALSIATVQAADISSIASSSSSAPGDSRLDIRV